jgi:Bacterial regulatory proteins, luxR family
VSAAEVLEQLERALTPREQETLRLWLAGASNAKTAAVLGIDRSSVVRYRHHIRAKARELGLRPELPPERANGVASTKPVARVTMPARQWALSLVVVERCARCSFTVTAPLDEARQAFRRHSCVAQQTTA